jgi:ABC-2 type transport system ATP-binding protein
MANPYNDLSGWENLMLMAALYGVPRREARARGERLLKALGLLERKDSLVRTYSKGMRQRLILGMALVSDPEVLFLDEPTSGLDVQSARLIREMLRSLKAEGKTIFLTTHDMDEANRLCDRVAIINKGRTVAIDAPERLRLAVRGRQSVEVSFNDSVDPEELARLPGVSEAQRVGDKCRLYTDDPGELVVALVNYSCAAGLRIVSLNILAPSLEEAFLALTEEAADG